MPEDDDMMSGGDEGGGTGGNTLPDTDPNACLIFVNGQFVPCPTPGNPEPEIPTQTLCPSCDQINPNFPATGTRSNYYWDSKSIIEKATKPLTKKKKS